MAKGRAGFYLEAWKFGVYLLIPIAASWYYSDPTRQRKAADYWQYVKYPASPNVDVKRQIEDLAKQERQRKAYRDQLVELNRQAQRGSSSPSSAASEGTDSSGDEGRQRRGWLRWIGLG